MSRIPGRKQTKKNKSAYSVLSFPQKILLLFGLIIATISMLPAIIVIFIGMLPTLTVSITDVKNTNKLIIIGGFNLSGVFMYILNIINNFTVDHALFLISNIFNLIIMFGSAAIGLIIYCELPNFFVFISKISAQKRLKTIDAKLEKLAEEWGTEIVNKHSEKEN